MIHVEDLKRVGIDLTKTDGIPVGKLFTMPRKISDLESDRRIANLLGQEVRTSQIVAKYALLALAVSLFVWLTR